jgi:Flp pilus assembly protein TadD
VIREQYVDDLSFVRAGKAFAAGGNDRGAVHMLRKALEINPKSTEAHVELGSALLRLGKLEQAVPHYEEVLRLDPRDYRAHNDLGVIRLRQGRLDEAKEHFWNALRLYPGFGPASSNLTRVLDVLRRRRDAVPQK